MQYTKSMIDERLKIPGFIRVDVGANVDYVNVDNIARVGASRSKAGETVLFTSGMVADQIIVKGDEETVLKLIREAKKS